MFGQRLESNPYAVMCLRSVTNIFRRALGDIVLKFANDKSFRGCVLKILDTRRQNIFDMIAHYGPDIDGDCDIFRSLKLLVDVNDIHLEAQRMLDDVRGDMFQNIDDCVLEIPEDVVCDEIDMDEREGRRYVGVSNVVVMVEDALEKFVPLRTYLDEELIDQREYDKCVAVLRYFGKGEDACVSLLGIYALCTDVETFECMLEKYTIIMQLLDRLQRKQYSDYHRQRYTCPAASLEAVEADIQLEDIACARKEIYAEDMQDCDGILKIILN